MKIQHSPVCGRHHVLLEGKKKGEQVQTLTTETNELDHRLVIQLKVKD